MAKALVYTITPKQLVDRIAVIAKEVRIWQSDLEQVNRMGGIDWPNRERLRSIQGHYGKIEDITSDLIWSEGDDYAADVAESIWGPTDPDE
jgi:hypothetical protein